MRITLIAVALCVFLAITCAAQESADVDRTKHEATQKLMTIVGTSELLRQMMDESIEQQIGGMRLMRPDVPMQFWNDFAVELKRQVNPQDLMDRIVPIYDRHFSEQEIRQLIAFYDSPLGRKISATLPEIQQESLQVGREWGSELGDRIGDQLNRRLQEKGYRPMNPHPHRPKA